MNTRREFVRWAGAAFACSWLSAKAAAEGDGKPAPGPGGSAPPRTGSDIGSLFPFVQSQAVRQDFPLSFLQGRFTDLRAWKRQARGKLLELLHYAPPRCEPRPEVAEKADQG